MATLLYVLVFLLPLGTRAVLGFVTPGVHEYEGIFLYATDLLIVLFVLSRVVRDGRWIGASMSSRQGALLATFLIAALASLIGATSVGLSLYIFVRLVLLALLAIYLAKAATQKKVFQGIITVLAVSALIQACIGIAQVSRQRSIGLQRFGEPVLVSYKGATSTFKVEGGRLLRAYGTFPHPNILGAFLAIGLLCLLYWYAETERRLANAVFPEEWRKAASLKKILQKRREITEKRIIKIGKLYFSSKYFFYRMLIAAATFIVMIGLVLTFSRSAWIAATIGIVLLLIWIVHQSFGTGARVIGLLVVSLVATYLISAPMIMPRARVVASEPAVVDRFAYSQIGLQTLSGNPFGVGAGNQVFYGVTNGLYRAQGMTKAWSFEPVHNLYLLVASELGWLGLLSFLAFLGIVCWQLIRSGPHLETGIAAALLVTLMVAGMFDHYLWDLQPGRLMFWVVIGLALSQVLKKPSSFKDPGSRA